MGLGNFFSKSKAKSIEVNGVKYSAPKDGICSLKVEEGKVFVNGEEATKDLIANVRYDSSKTNDIYVGGTFMGKISDTSSTPLDSWADITIKGKANGEIHTITQGDIRIGEE